MDFPKLNTGNFCCFALRTRVSAGLTRPVQFGSGLHASPTQQFDVDDWWQEQLGKLQINEIGRSTIFLFALTSDPEFDVNLLNSQLSSHYHSLLLQGVGYSKQGVLLAGVNSSEGMRVNSIGRLVDYFAPPKVVGNGVTASDLHATVQLVTGLDTIFQDPAKQEYLRLRKGFNAFLDGMKHIQHHNRLHQFVRSIDGVIKPKKGEGTNKFKHRCGFFAGQTTQHLELLEELYELRSAAEHLNPLDDKLAKYQAHERDNMKALRTYQSELLASFVYRKILSTPILLSSFINDAAIDLMWGQTASQLIALWGNTIDLQTASEGLFFDYL